MEKYVKLEDINIMLSKMYKEPRYQHEDEDFYSGVSQVACNLMDVPTIKLEEPKVGKWIDIRVAPDKIYWKCSVCGKETDLPNYEKVCFCFNCGAKMTKE